MLCKHLQNQCSELYIQIQYNTYTWGTDGVFISNMYVFDGNLDIVDDLWETSVLGTAMFERRFKL